MYPMSGVMMFMPTSPKRAALNLPGSKLGAAVIRFIVPVDSLLMKILVEYILPGMWQ